MLCERCHGKGVTQTGSACGTARAPCPECGACGILHCCEGVIEQPSPPTPSSQRREERQRRRGPPGSATAMTIALPGESWRPVTEQRMARSDPPHVGRRLRCGAALAAVVALGLASRAWPVGWAPYDKSLGDLL